MENLILVVDDSPETLGMLNDALEAAGMTTLVALDGKQAIKIASKMKPDIILLDAVMPHMDGFETCQKIKQDAALSATPVIFMTGLSDVENVVKGLEVGGVDYLTKPINPAELIARMKVHLSNALLTLRAQNALSTTGQDVFTADLAGEIKWSSPIVERFLCELSESQQLNFKQDIKKWLSHEPVKGASLQVNDTVLNTSVVFIDKADDNEFLLRLLNKQQSDAEVFKAEFCITKRESEVLSWIAKGKTNREIGLILSMSPRTVNKHLEQIFKKVEVDNRTSAARKAIKVLQNKRGY